MSERDLPSKILREQNQDMTDGGLHGLRGGHHMMQPRIQSSKSVPSLNSEASMGGSGSGGLGMGDNRNIQTSLVPPMVRSPGGPHSHGHGHHVEPPTSPRYPQNYPSMSMTMQPMSSNKSHMGGMHHHMDSSMQMQHPGAHRSRYRPKLSAFLSLINKLCLNQNVFFLLIIDVYYNFQINSKFDRSTSST